MMRVKPPLSCEIEGRVAFYEVDPLQIVWHGNYFNYFELARQTLLARRDVDLYEYGKHTQFFFPIIRTATTHYSPLRYGDIFICLATLAEARTKIVVDFEVSVKNQSRICAKGRTEQVAVKMPEMELQIFIPEKIRNALLP
jgi:acyl-CoA thioester hydrolase